MRLGLPFKKKKCGCEKRRDSKGWLLYIACPARTRAAIIHMAMDFLLADPLDMYTYCLSFWLVSHMAQHSLSFLEKRGGRHVFTFCTFWKEEV